MQTNFDNLTVSNWPTLESIHYLNIVSRSPFCFMVEIIVMDIHRCYSFKLVLKFSFHKSLRFKATHLNVKLWCLLEYVNYGVFLRIIVMRQTHSVKLRCNLNIVGDFKMFFRCTNVFFLSFFFESIRKTIILSWGCKCEIQTWVSSHSLFYLGKRRRLKFIFSK